MSTPSVKFNPNKHKEFIKELRTRVNSYFKNNNISRFGNLNMVLKSIFMLSLYLIPYFLVVFNVFSNNWVILLMWILMGMGMAGIGLSIMHDANQDVYSKLIKYNMDLFIFLFF